MPRDGFTTITISDEQADWLDEKKNDFFGTERASYREVIEELRNLDDG